MYGRQEEMAKVADEFETLLESAQNEAVSRAEKAREANDELARVTNRMYKDSTARVEASR